MISWRLHPRDSDAVNAFRIFLRGLVDAGVPLNETDFDGR